MGPTWASESRFETIQASRQASRRRGRPFGSPDEVDMLNTVPTLRRNALAEFPAEPHHAIFDVGTPEGNVGHVDAVLRVISNLMGCLAERGEEDQAEFSRKRAQRSVKDPLPILIVFEDVAHHDALDVGGILAKVDDAIGDGVWLPSTPM